MPEWLRYLFHAPTERESVAQGLFFGGSGRRVVAHTRPAFPKNAYDARVATLFITDKVYKVYFSVGTRPKNFLVGEGKMYYSILFYVALASPSHRPQSFFPFIPYNKFLHPPNHATTTKIPHLLHETLLKTRQNVMTYVQRVKGWWGIGEKCPRVNKT